MKKASKSKTTASSTLDPWVRDVERDMRRFATQHGAAYQKTERQLSAAFEIGCFLLLAKDYERQGIHASPQNLVEGQFRYLTTPNGNPHNFSFLRMSVGGVGFEVRQQVRVRSHVDADIFFTPDIVVLDAASTFGGGKDSDYAGGNRRFFVVDSSSVIAAHECKSMTGFPELYVSFLGLTTIAHAWLQEFDRGEVKPGERGHLAPTLFVGGESSNLHRRMITALENAFPINIVTGIYKGGWVLAKREAKVRRLPVPNGDSDALLLPGKPAPAIEPEDIEVPF